MNWQSNHPLAHKRSVVRTLLDRANSLTTDPIELKHEKRHIREVLKVNGYKKWAMNLPPRKPKTPESNVPAQSHTVVEKPKPIALPYVQGTPEELQLLFRK